MFKLALSIFLTPAWAHFTVALLDGEVNLTAPGVREFVCSQMLADLRLTPNDPNDPGGDGHGTRVARELLRNLPADRVRLVPITIQRSPRARDIVKMAATMAALSFYPEAPRRRFLEKTFQAGDAQISAALRAANAKVVVITAYNDGEGGRWLFRIPVARNLLEATTTLLTAFIRNHPDILFVIAAGNEGRALRADRKFNTLVLGLENLVVVGARGGAKPLARWSNFSPEFVDVLAAGDDETGASGTSFSAPKVANLIASAWLENPGASVAAIKAILKNEYCVASEGARPYVRDGCVLPSILGNDDAFVIPLEGPPTAEALEVALHGFAAGTSDELISRQGGLDERWFRPTTYQSAVLARLSRGAVDTTRSVRARLRHWAEGTGEIKLVIPFSVDGTFVSAGVLIKDGRARALDHASRIFETALNEALADADADAAARPRPPTTQPSILP